MPGRSITLELQESDFDRIISALRKDQERNNEVAKSPGQIAFGHRESCGYEAEFIGDLISKLRKEWQKQHPTVPINIPTALYAVAARNTRIYKNDLLVLPNEAWALEILQPLTSGRAITTKYFSGDNRMLFFIEEPDEYFQNYFAQMGCAALVVDMNKLDERKQS